MKQMSKKAFLAFLVGAGLVVLFGGSCQAAIFQDTVEFGDDGCFKGRDYQILSGQGNSFTFSYQHNVTFIPPAASITSAQVVLSHSGNSISSGEYWELLFQGAEEPALRSVGRTNLMEIGWIRLFFFHPRYTLP